MPQDSSNGVDKVMTLSGYGNGSESDDVNQHEHRQGEKMTKKKRRHPLKMPLRTDPVTKRIICRFHNYDAQSGCKKYNHCCENPGCGEENICPLDHETCHICLEKGHPAHRCSHLDNPDSKLWEEFCSLTLKNTRPDDYPTNKTVLGDTILWIGDTATIAAAIPSSSSTNDASGDGDNATTETIFLIAPPKIYGFMVGEDDQLGRCRRQKKIEAAFMLQLGQGSVIVDAGAHLGDTVLTLAIHARAKNRTDLRFVALEPCPEKCDFIRSVVAANKLSIKVICAAVGDSMGVVQPASNAKERATRDGSLRYEYCPNQKQGMEAAGQCIETNTRENASANVKEPSNYSDGEIESKGETKNKSIPMITLDSIIDQISPLGMLHIDVEGWESNVLRGAKKSLTTMPECSNEKSRYPCYVIAEAWTEKESLRRGVSGNAEEKIVRVMEDEVNENHDSNAGYRFERINDIVDIERNLVYVRKRKG